MSGAIDVAGQPPDPSLIWNSYRTATRASSVQEEWIRAVFAGEARSDALPQGLALIEPYDSLEDALMRSAA